MNKLVGSIREAILQSGLRDGMTISFHHHLRNGDWVLNAVVDEAARMGLRDLRINASSLFAVHEPLVEQIKNGVVTAIDTSYISGPVGQAISRGALARPVRFFTHGGRAAAIESGEAHIDVAFIAAPCADPMGNCSGKYGPSACGSLGYAFADARHADKVVVLTDHLVPYPLADCSIPETCVDCVVELEKLGDPAGIASGTTKITRDPVGLLMARQAARAIRASGLLRDGISFQTGAGGASLATAKYLQEMMLAEGIKGSFLMGGTTGYLVDLLKSGCFETILDTQCFDLEAVASLRENPAHVEVSAGRYASPKAKSAIVDSLDVVILGATEIDASFNVNVHTDSNGVIMGGSGGHSDTAAGAKLSIIIAPLVRARLPVVVDRVTCVSTPGETVDALVTQRGVAVNPRRPELRDRLRRAGLPVMDIRELKALAERIAGAPRPLPAGGRVVADVVYRDGTVIDHIRELPGLDRRDSQ